MCYLVSCIHVCSIKKSWELCKKISVYTSKLSSLCAKAGSHWLGPKLNPLYFNHTEIANNNQFFLVLASSRWHLVEPKWKLGPRKDCGLRKPPSREGVVTLAKQQIQSPDSVLCNFLPLCFFSTPKKYVINTVLLSVYKKENWGSGILIQGFKCQNWD